MKLRNDPYQVFRFSKTPAGLYARQKWLGEADSSQWKTDFQETVDVLLSDQSPDGSWHHETAATIKHLFGLHLTVRSSNAQIEAALTWLLAGIEVQPEKVHVSPIYYFAQILTCPSQLCSHNKIRRIYLWTLRDSYGQPIFRRTRPKPCRW